MSPTALQGFTVGVTADRRADEQAELLTRRGAEVVLGPTIRMLPLGPDDGLRRATESLIEQPPDVVLANTGVGIRGWLAAAESWGLDGPLLDSLRRARVMGRGPKASGALVTAGVAVDWQAPTEQFAGLVDHVLSGSPSGLRVAVQLDGNLGDPAAALAAAGCVVVRVPVYRWTVPDDDSPARRLVEWACGGRIDAVTFTSAPSVRNLVLLADRWGMGPALRRAFDSRVLGVCVGPVCRAEAERAGLARLIEPQRARMGAMVAALAAALGRERRSFTIASLEVTVQGTAMVVDGRPASMTVQERDLFAALARRRGAVVTRAALLSEVWGSQRADPHVLEVAVARLRRRLGPAGPGLETVVRRGYRLAAVAVDRSGAGAHPAPIPR